ncbi:unnamed protein product [Fraxinus pennsylvanica]|uniref:Homeobox-leucine zipper protein n=1 Tax=Fraxinus pennsylvanica TaxID=56036 RepID=A0AAD2DTE5_9LAMI|nr:unnamed protein product [Fraxinus pennsylvanica]
MKPKRQNAALFQNKGNDLQPSSSFPSASLPLSPLFFSQKTENRAVPLSSSLSSQEDLQPRQVVVWFQNRRARWKTKQLERDYDQLKSAYDSLVSNYDSILEDNEKLKVEVQGILVDWAGILVEEEVEQLGWLVILLQRSWQ